MHLERRALYNLLRMNWLNDSSLIVESWQVEDYRALPLAELFRKLREQSIPLDKLSFTAYAEKCDSPEELTGYLIGDNTAPEIEDRIYLIFFELWRRLMSEKPSPSIYCDELDHQIYLFDQGESTNLLALQTSIANLLFILDENVDAGIDPSEALQRLAAYCANDIEEFLYDFIFAQIEEEQLSYAQELLDDFNGYFKDNPWFTTLRIRLLSHSNAKSANRILNQLIEDLSENQDLDLNLELLSITAEAGSHPLFQTLVKRTTSLLIQEEDFQDLLSICVDYYHRLDQEHQENLLQNILNKRAARSLTSSFAFQDRDLIALLEIIDFAIKK